MNNVNTDSFLLSTNIPYALLFDILAEYGAEEEHDHTDKPEEYSSRESQQPSSSLSTETKKTGITRELERGREQTEEVTVAR